MAALRRATSGARRARAATLTWLASGWLLASVSCRSYNFCDETACGARAGAFVSGGATGEGQGGTSGAGDAGGRGGHSGGAGAATGGSDASGGELGGAGAEGGGESWGGLPAGGSGGDKGEAATPCQAPLAECDGSSFTPCETDTSNSALHCGGCKRRCTGVCSDGRCLEPTTLIEQLTPVERGLARIGEAFYALSDERLYTFEEGQQIALELAPGVPNLRLLEAAPDRLFLGDGRHWWSASASAPDALVDEGISALDAKFMDGAFFWVDESQVIRVTAAGAEGIPYCTLPSADFQVEELTLSRVAAATAAVFRRGAFASDVVSCPAWQRASVGAPAEGRLIIARGPSEWGAAHAGAFYWTEGTRLLRADGEGAAEELFSSPRDEISFFSFLVVESSLILPFEKAFSGGLHTIALDSSRPPRTVGVLEPVHSLFVDESAARLCYADPGSNRVACLPFTDLEP